MDQQDQDKEPTEVERRLAERAEAEEAKFEREMEEIAAAAPADAPASPAEPPISMFDQRWEPPNRQLYDFEVIALVNRDLNFFLRERLKADSPEEIEAFTDRQLERYFRNLSIYQVDYYRMKLAENLFGLALNQVMEMQYQIREAQRRQAANQIAQEANRPDKRRRGN